MFFGKSAVIRVLKPLIDFLISDVKIMGEKTEIDKKFYSHKRCSWV